MEKIDVFAHVLLPQFFETMKKLDKDLLVKMPFLQNPILWDMDQRRQHLHQGIKQIISYVNTNPEDYLPGKAASLLVRKANQELLDTVRAHSDIFAGGVAMLALNNLEDAIKIVDDFVLKHPEILGVQLFSRHLGKSLADPEFKPLIRHLAEREVPIWLHPVFDSRKPDNNIIFSWEYEQTQAMLQLVEAGYFQAFPHLKIIVHHAGAMAPYFAGRIDRILPEPLATDFRKFYVDTALLGNSKALELCVDYFGPERVLFGTDAPLGILPAGASQEIIEAIEAMNLSQEERDLIYYGNFIKHFKKEV